MEPRGGLLAGGDIKCECDTTFYKIFAVLGDEYPRERNLHQDCGVYLYHLGGDIKEWH